jgi:ElaB/YqjD/DUF883 family membrane-anchored ribosome-binding protein
LPVPIKNEEKEYNNMEKNKHAARNAVDTLAEDARALMTATAHVAGEKVEEARERLAAALESAKEMAGNVRDKAVAGAKVTDEAIRENPYKAIAIGAAAGVLIGFLVGRSRKN